MRRAVKLLFASLTFTFTSVAFTSVARADSVVITFTNPIQTLVAGTNGSVIGSFTNISASPVTISGSLLTFNIVGQVEGTLIVFFPANEFLNLVSPLGGGPLTLAPGESTDVIPIFTFQLSPFFAGPSPAIVNGQFIVSFGDPFVAANQLGQASYSITVLPNPAVPEPATLVLLGTSLFAMAATGYRKRKNR
jgi:hypothetical protein